MMRRKTTLFALGVTVATIFATQGMAQNGKAEADYQPSALGLAVLPSMPQGLAIVNSLLWCNAQGVMLAAQPAAEATALFWPDTTVARYMKGANYVVRHYPSADYYFTAVDNKGVSSLYVCRPNHKKKRASVKRVDLGKMNVVHPTFSADGKIMVFASDYKEHSIGGYDLWYSVLERGKWSKPTNMGRRINTTADEVTPHIAGEYLFFSSNGRHEQTANHDVYVTRLVSDQIVGDTASMLQVGMQLVQHMPSPINSTADDTEFLIDTATATAYWLTNTTAHNTPIWQLYSLADAVGGIMLWGRIVDASEQPVGGVAVMVGEQGRPACATISDETGYYRLYLRSGRHYSATYSADGYFSTTQPITTPRHSGQNFIADMRHDVQLGNLPVGRTVQYTDLFGYGADIQLSQRGRELLQPIIDFVHDNPTYIVGMALECDLTTDATYNRLLTQQRLQTLAAYLSAHLPRDAQYTLRNACEGQEGCTSASCSSRLSVLITPPEN